MAESERLSKEHPAAALRTKINNSDLHTALSKKPTGHKTLTKSKKKGNSRSRGSKDRNTINAKDVIPLSSDDDYHPFDDSRELIRGDSDGLNLSLNVDVDSLDDFKVDSGTGTPQNERVKVLSLSAKEGDGAADEDEDEGGKIPSVTRISEIASTEENAQSHNNAANIFEDGDIISYHLKMDIGISNSEGKQKEEQEEKIRITGQGQDGKASSLLSQLTKECQVCYESCDLACKICQKVFYCSKLHQVSDWPKHKLDCFPAIFFKEQDSHETIMVATKDIRQGEKILKEKPFLVLPSTKENLDHICLGCLDEVETSVSCSKCKWDICSIECERDSLHAEYECQIFSKKQVLPPIACNAVQLMDAVAILRCLLFKEREPDKWRRYTADLVSEFRSELLPLLELREYLNCQNFIKFIREECGLTQFDEQVIDRTHRILMLNKLHLPDVPASFQDHRRAALLFKNFTVPGTSCVPNARWAIGGRTSMKYYGVIGASVDIKKGEHIHCDFSQDLSGTYIRRQMIKKFQRGRDCTCARCQDPTELGTYLTAVKCRDNPRCKDGNLVAEFPLDNRSGWKCESCGVVVDASYIVTLISRMSEELEALGEQIEEAEIRGLENIIKKYKGKILHENHFLIMHAQYDYCHRVTQNASHLAMYEMKTSWGEKVVEYCKHLLNVTENIMPGFHRYKGRVIYCLQFGLLISIFGMKSSNNTTKKRISSVLKRYRRKKYEEAIAAQKLAVEFLQFEPEDSDEGEMVKTLREQLSESQVGYDNL